MDFINQVKKLKDLTKSPEVKQICESFLSGSSNVSKDQVLAAINEHASTETTPELKSHWDAIKNEQLEASKKAAAALMESWNVNKRTSFNSGSYTSQENKKEDNTALLESLSSLASKDNNARSFVEAQGLKNLGVLESIQKMKGLSISEYPKAKIVLEQYSNLILNKNVPEFSLIHNFIAELESFKWDVSVTPIAESLKNKAKKFSREIEVSKVLESIKNSGSSSFYSDLSESLNNWLVSESKSSGLLSKEISKWSFNPIVRNLVNFLNENEATDSRKLELPINAQGESSVKRIYSPILIEGSKTLFVIGNSIFESNEEGFKKLSSKELKSVPSDFIGLANAILKPYTKISEGVINVQLGKKTVTLVEENEATSVYLGRTKLNFRNVGELAKILGLESASHFAVNESQVVSDIINIYVNFSNIVELDFAKNIKSNIYEGVEVNLIKWNNTIYLQRINESMRENSVYKVNGSQAVKMVKEFMRYDISEGLTEFLEGEQKIKSIMVNDRTKVLENISKVEEQIAKIEGLMENNPLYSSSKEIRSAHGLLSKELMVLREKWNQINLEIEKVEAQPSLEILSEDEKFNIGSYVKIKESGETGKIISVDGTSGRYTVLLDNGKTSDFLVNEISDLEEALGQAAEKNAESNSDEDSDSGEVKESNNLNKSTLTVKEQKNLLKTFSDGHGFSKAPAGDESKQIDMELDQLHGYNLTMNEAKEKAAKAEKPQLSKAPGDSKMAKDKDPNKGDMAKAPGNDKKVKGKIEGKELLDDNAPDTKNKTEFDGSDEKDNKYDIGYNLREGKETAPNLSEAPVKGRNAKETNSKMGDANLAETPEGGSHAKETKGKTNIEKLANLAKSPGKEGDISFDAEDSEGEKYDIGYNIAESDTLKKN